MPYRRTFLILLAASMLLMDGLWWYSLTHLSTATWFPFRNREGMLLASFGSASVTLACSPNIGGGPGGIGTGPLTRVPYDNGEAPGPMGKFRIGKESPYGYPANMRMWLVEFPIWFPWLLLAGGGYLYLGYIRRHSLSARERALALESSARQGLERSPEAFLE